mgnify:CR=1 FL=1
MTKNQEDVMFEIYGKVEMKGLRKRFNKQLRKMGLQNKHKYTEMCERWEYAYNKVINGR